MDPQDNTSTSTPAEDPIMSFLPRTLASTSTRLAARSIASTSVPNIVNRLPEPHPSPEHPPRTNEGVRVCQVISVKPERLEEYEKVHREVWPGVLNALRRANVVDYSIHHMVLPLTPSSTTSASESSMGTHLLIAHMRYMGKREDFDRDMSKVGEDPETQKWWKLTDSMQTSFVDGAVGSASGPGWWSTGREVFRFEG